MLVELPEDWVDTYANPDGLRAWMNKYEQWPKRISQGMYHTHLNFNLDIKSLIASEWPFEPEMNLPLDTPLKEALAVLRKQALRTEEPSCSYGACDTPQQLIDKFPFLNDSPRRFLVRFVHVRKCDETPGGWRWHKWGPYIGTKEPQCEYLYDEPEIEEVWIYHIYEMNE